MYEYRATLLGVVDGDTLDLLVDKGFQDFSEIRFRLYGVDTPELRSSDPEERARAQAAKQFLIDRLPTERNALTIRTYRDSTDKYGRYLATIYCSGVEPHVNAALIEAGHATPYFGTGPRGAAGAVPASPAIGA